MEDRDSFCSLKKFEEFGLLNECVNRAQPNIQLDMGNWEARRSTNYFQVIFRIFYI